MEDLLKDYGAELEWNVGSLFCHDETLHGTFGVVKICQEFGVPNPVKWAFGSIPSLLSGGRVPPYDFGREEALSILGGNLDRGVACRLTLSNPYATQSDIQKDVKSRDLLDFLNTHSIDSAKNGVIVSCDLVAEHVREAYPNLEVILSILRTVYDVGYGKDRNTVEYYSNLLENPLYDRVVVDSAKVHEEGFIESLPRKDKIELIACVECIRNCPIARQHYDAIHTLSQCICYGLDRSKAYERIYEVMDQCVANKRKHPDQNLALNENEIKKLASIGCRQFKIAGRVNTDANFKRDLFAYLFKYERARYLESALIDSNFYRQMTENSLDAQAQS